MSKILTKAKSSSAIGEPISIKRGFSKISDKMRFKKGVKRVKSILRQNKRVQPLKTNNEYLQQEWEEEELKITSNDNILSSLNCNHRLNYKKFLNKLVETVQLQHPDKYKFLDSANPSQDQASPSNRNTSRNLNPHTGIPATKEAAEEDLGLDSLHYDYKRALTLRRNKYKKLWQRVLSRIILGKRAIRVWSSVGKEIVLFGAKSMRRSTDPEEERIGVTKKCLFMPDSRFKVIWTILMMILLMYTAIFVPFKLAFLDVTSVEIVLADYITDFLFAADLVLNFFYAFYDENHYLITDRKNIASRYLRTSFIFDLVVCMPFQLIEPNSDSNQYNGLLRLLKLPRFYKIFRIFKLLKMIRSFGALNPSIEKFLFRLVAKAGTLRLVQLLFTLLLSVHIFGCLWFIVASIDDFNPETW
jgi:hypothetical protein